MIRNLLYALALSATLVIAVILCLSIPTVIIFFVWNNVLRQLFNWNDLTIGGAFGIYVLLIVIGGVFKSGTSGSKS